MKTCLPTESPACRVFSDHLITESPPVPNYSPQEGLRLRGALLQSALLVEAKSACQSLAASPVLDSGDDTPIAW